MKAQNVKLKDQTIIVHGAGTAGMGISEWIVRALKSIDGVDEDTARAQFYLVDKQGLLLDDDDELTEHQKAFARPRADIKDWKTSGDHLELIDVVKQVKPTIVRAATYLLRFRARALTVLPDSCGPLRSSAPRRRRSRGPRSSSRRWSTPRAISRSPSSCPSRTRPGSRRPPLARLPPAAASTRPALPAR